jgi:hypothetical protein
MDLGNVGFGALREKTKIRKKKTKKQKTKQNHKVYRVKRLVVQKVSFGWHLVEKKKAVPTLLMARGNCLRKRQIVRMGLAFC